MAEKKKKIEYLLIITRTDGTKFTRTFTTEGARNRAMKEYRNKTRYPGIKHLLTSFREAK